MAGWPAASVLLVLGWGLLAIVNPRLLVLVLLVAVPWSTFGWQGSLATIDGRVLDVRLVVTFAVAATGGLALALRPLGRIVILEWLVLALAFWQTVSGLIAADSILTWAPPVTRTVAYGAVFALARRHLHFRADLKLAFGLMVLAFGVPTLAGLVQFIAGEAEFLNEAVRATSPGGRGPISLAFAGQMTVLTAYGLLQTTSVAWRRGSAGAAMAVGALGVIASATRLITATTWLSLVAFSAVRRQWIAVVLVTIATSAGVVVRGDLIDRFAGTIESQPSPTSTVDPDMTPGSRRPSVPAHEEPVGDASLRFRFFVWGAVLDEWSNQPVTGIGPGMTAHVVAERSSAERTAPHNDYIGFLAETSIVGLFLFIAAQATVLASLLRPRADRRASSRRALVVLTAILFVSTNILGALNNPIYFFDVQVGLWALVGCAVVASRDLAGRDQGPSDT